MLTPPVLLVSLPDIHPRVLILDSRVGLVESGVLQQMRPLQEVELEVLAFEDVPVLQLLLVVLLDVADVLLLVEGVQLETLLLLLLLELHQS